MINLENLLTEGIGVQLLVEGGAQGHLAHIFEDGKLTFAEMRDIFKKLFTGKLEVSEKTDGAAIAVTYKDGEFRFARNKATIKDPMDINQLAAKFEGRGEIKNAFVNSMKDLVKALSTLDQNELNSIFANGKNYMACEIIAPGVKNIVDYGNRCLIQFHGVNVYDEKFNRVSEDKEAAKKLFELVKSHSALKQDTYEIAGPAILKLKNAKSSEKALVEVLEDLDKIVDGLGYKANINTYIKERYQKYIVNMATKSGLDLDRSSDFVSELADRLSAVSGRKPTKSDLITYAKHDGIDFKSEEYKKFIELMDSTIDEVNTQLIRPIENLVIKTGMLLFEQLTGYISADPKESAKKIAAELDETIAFCKSDDNGLSPEKIKRFKRALKKLDDYQKKVSGIEGIVFVWPKTGKVYKLTGTFGAINAINGLIKFG